MFESLKKLLGWTISDDPLSTARAIYAYVSEFKDDDKRQREEIHDRGLSFGDLPLDRISGKNIEFYLSHERAEDISLDQMRAMLRKYILKKKFTWLSVQKDRLSSHARLVVESDKTTPSATEGVRWSEIKDLARPSRRHVFLTIEKVNGIRFSVNGVQGLAMILHMMKKLGFAITPIHHAYESNLSTEEIVMRAFHWRDKRTGKHYVEIAYDATEEKRAVWSGVHQTEAFAFGDIKIVILGGIHKAPRLKLNNRIVDTQEISQPTTYMLKAQERIRERQKKRYTCSVKDCGRAAVHQINIARFEMSGIEGTTRTGEVLYSCENLAHRQQLVKNADGIRVTVSQLPALEVW